MKEHFNFSRNQKIGVAALSILIVAGIVLLNVNYNQYLPERTDVLYSDFDLSSNDDLSNGLTNENESDLENKIDYFDPNEISVVDWEDLGFSEKQAKSIVKYRDAYGPFENANEVGKIYVISDEKFKELKPFMIFTNPETSQNNDFKNDEYVPYSKELLQIEINSASKEELESISGIGPTFSERIVKYRNLLGGFYSSNQYSEVYGLKEESLKALEDNTVIDREAITKIKINSCSKSDLKKHPFFKKWEVTAAVMTERQKQKLTSLQFLIEQKVVSESEVEKMNHYTSFE